jgi:hypothetical protein
MVRLVSNIIRPVVAGVLLNGEKMPDNPIRSDALKEYRKLAHHLDVRERCYIDVT